MEVILNATDIDPIRDPILQAPPSDLEILKQTLIDQGIITETQLSSAKSTLIASKVAL